MKSFILFLCATTALVHPPREAPASAPAQLLMTSAPYVSSRHGASAPKRTNEIKLAILGSIRLYQILLSSQDTPRCNFQPTCSHFGQEAISQFGVQGVLMTSDRLLRCNGMSMDRYAPEPVTGKAIDPVAPYVLWGERAAMGRSADRSRLASLRAGPTPSPAQEYPEQEASAPLDYYSPAGIRAFADFLFAQEDYARAAGEYQRFLFLSGHGDAAADTVLFRIGRCLRLSGEASAAAPYFEKVVDRRGTNGLACAAFHQLVYLDWDQGRYDNAIRRLAASDDPGVSRGPDCPTGVPRAVSFLLAGRWSSASEILSRLTEDETRRYNGKVAELARLAGEGMNADRRSPLIASILSAVIPGAGKMWLGRTWDGIFSLTTCAATTWVAAEGFNENGSASVQGWIFGSLAAGFYAGNVYGSAVAARNINEAAIIKIQKRVGGLACELDFTF